MSNVGVFPTYTYRMACFDILVAFQHNGTLEINSGPFFEKIVKIFIFFGFPKSIFFNHTPKIVFLGYESDRYVKKLHFFSIFRIFKFWSILTTFDQVLSKRRTQQNLPFSTFQKSIFYYLASKGGQKCRKVKFSIFPTIDIK